MCSSMHNLNNTCFYYDTRFTLMPKKVEKHEKEPNHPSEGQPTKPTKPIRTNSHAAHNTKELFFFTHISIQATATSSQLLMRL